MEISSPNGIVSLSSSHGFADTVQRLLTAFEGHGLKVFAVIDQRAEAVAVGLDMPPTTLVIFGNPRAGTPVMVAQPLSALDLPLKVLVTESVPGEVRVSFNATDYLVQRHGLSEEMGQRLLPAEGLIAKAVTA